MNHVPIRPLHTVSLLAFHKAGSACLRASPACRVSGFECYDAAQQLASVRLPTGTLSLADRQWTAPKKITFPGGSVQTRDYDALLRPTRIKVSDPGQSTLIDRQYSYDPESNITQKATEHGDYGYGYDDLYRLTTVDSPSGLPDEAWTYDKLGNRLTDETKPGDWQYNANNQLTQSYTTDGKAVTHSYDENGSLIEQASPSGEATDNQRYVYDAQNRLIEVQDSTGATLAVYQYDPYGRRIAKTVQQNGTSTTTTYLYSDEGLIGEATATGTLAVEYGWQPGNLWGTDPLYIRTTKTNGTDPEVFYYQNDHLGTPQAIVDQAGNIVWSAKALAFGETTVSTEASITNNLRFPGQYYDLETGTHYNFFRDYDPDVGRYRESDPIGLEGGINTYVYVYGDPLNDFDPTGENPFLGALIGAGTDIAIQLLFNGGRVECIKWDVVLIAAVSGAFNPFSALSAGNKALKAQRQFSRAEGLRQGSRAAKRMAQRGSRHNARAYKEAASWVGVEGGAEGVGNLIPDEDHWRIPVDDVCEKECP